MTADTLNVRSYFDTIDYLVQKREKKQAKERTRDGEARHTPISRFVNPETAYVINQFKSPRSSS